MWLPSVSFKGQFADFRVYRASLPRSVSTYVTARVRRVSTLLVAIPLILMAVATSAQAQSIRLAWDAVSSPSGVSYQIERGTKGGSYTHTINVTAGVTTYEVTGLW